MKNLPEIPDWVRLVAYFALIIVVCVLSFLVVAGFIKIDDINAWVQGVIAILGLLAPVFALLHFTPNKN